MLYLAETQKKTGFMGGGKAEFKLLACQRSEHDWSSVPGEELIVAPDDAPYASGVLVLLELSNNRQIKRHQEASRTLVSVLQNFSGLSKKFKSQGEEIEQWKESLTYQSQALNRREMEIEARQEQVEQAEAELEKVQEERQALDEQKANAEKLQEELSRKTAELEGAWAQLNGEMQRFEENKESLEASAPAGLSDEQLSQVTEALSQIGSAVPDCEALGQGISALSELLAGQQETIHSHQGYSSELHGQIDAAQSQLEERSQVVEAQRNQLREAESALQATQSHLLQQQILLGAKQDQNQLLTEQLKNQTDFHQRVYALLNTADKVRLSKKVDVAELEAMSEEALQALVTNLEQDLDKMSRFVQDQEEELRLQQEDIDALVSKLDDASEYDRLQIETEIAEEKDRHVMLNRTLVGQRRNLLEREEILSQHRAVLLRKQGLAAEGTGAAAELEPVLDEIDALRSRLGEQIQAVESESATIQSEINALKQTRQTQQEAVESQKAALQSAESDYQVQLQTMGDLKGQLAIYESLLPGSAGLAEGLAQHIEGLSGGLQQLRESAAQQQSSIDSVMQLVNGLRTPQPALV